ncbi:MAG: hypothetical protein ACT6RN_04335 [Agrobacterium sp.]
MARCDFSEIVVEQGVATSNVDIDQRYARRGSHFYLAGLSNY